MQTPHNTPYTDTTHILVYGKLNQTQGCCLHVALVIDQSHWDVMHCHPGNKQHHSCCVFYLSPGMQASGNLRQPWVQWWNSIFCTLVLSAPALSTGASCSNANVPLLQSPVGGGLWTVINVACQGSEFIISLNCPDRDTNKTSWKWLRATVMDTIHQV